MTSYSKVQPPADGETIQIDASGELNVPDNPIIPQIIGDGIGPDISRAMVRVVDAAVEKTSGGKRRIAWFPVHAGEAAMELYDSALPEDTLNAIREFRVSIKGPLTTPVGGGFRSLNVALRQIFDLYACIRPVRWFVGVPSPVKAPEKLDVVIFRENTEDIYKGIEFEANTPDAKKMIDFLKNEYDAEVRADSGIGIKPVSITGSKRLVRMAIEYALEKGRDKVTLVHKGNIMKFTEGAFRDWGYETAEQEFPDKTYTWSQWERTKKEKGEEAANAEQESALAGGRVLIKDAIADITLQQVLTRPKEFDVIATLNLNGDYLSDALAAQVGGIGIAPGGNINYLTGHAIFEATHGTAPKYANQDKVNPGSLILSGEMMLRYMGWTEAADLIIKGIGRSIEAKEVTYDFERLMRAEGTQAKLLKCSEFSQAIIRHMD